jgi:hypothetical protein
MKKEKGKKGGDGEKVGERHNGGKEMKKVKGKWEGIEIFKGR